MMVIAFTRLFQWRTEFELMTGRIRAMHGVVREASGWTRASQPFDLSRHRISRSYYPLPLAKAFDSC